VARRVHRIGDARPSEVTSRSAKRLTRRTQRSRGENRSSEDRVNRRTTEEPKMRKTEECKSVHIMSTPGTEFCFFLPFPPRPLRRSFLPR
jgi:hypothetical protein